MGDFSDENPVRGRIVEAAIHCIQREGIESVTSRGIAKEAGVNAAALNYYFGSKERVVELALEQALHSAFLDRLTELERFMRRHGNLREAMIALLDETIEAATRYPNVGFALVHETMSKQRYDSPFARKLSEFLDQLFARVGHALRGETEERRRASLAQLWSAVLIIGTLPRAFDSLLTKDLGDPEGRLAYVRTMVDCHFADVTRRAAPRKAREKKRPR